MPNLTDRPSAGRPIQGKAISVGGVFSLTAARGGTSFMGKGDLAGKQGLTAAFATLEGILLRDEKEMHLAATRIAARGVGLRITVTTF